MADSYLSEDELKEFRERIQATYEMGEKYKAKLVHPGNVQFNPLDVILAFYTERLNRSSDRLNILTLVLIGLTVILAFLTGFLVWKSFIQ